MKINEPVTQNEVKMREGSVLVSKTNLKGMITYVNQDFMDISGYSKEELIGKNHNIVRHPDMPPEAFKWLWDELKADNTWAAPVKNRAKNGDYYWVNANVSPIRENGKIVEYMSVRTRPSEEVIKQSDQLYQDINSGKVSLEKTGLQKFIGSIGKIKTSSWLYFSFGLATIFMMLSGLLLISGSVPGSIGIALFCGAIVTLIAGILSVRNYSKPLEYFTQ